MNDYVDPMVEAAAIRTKLTLPDEMVWEDPDPYSSANGVDTYHETEVFGELADRVRTAFNASESVPVIIREEKHLSYISDYTSSVDYDFVIRCGGNEKAFNNELVSDSGLVRLIAWLDEAAPKKA
jgi:hypothetical protein